MQRVPVEVAEQIIAKLSDEDLFIGSSVCRVWWQVVRQEAYKRWKEYACRIGDIYREIQAIREEELKDEINWLDAEYELDILDYWMDALINIMKKMLRYGMIIDLQEKKIIEHASSEYNWEGDPWLGMK
jgi:hypothetical protein